MQDGNKYVPPHLRNQGGGGSNVSSSNYNNQTENDRGEAPSMPSGGGGGAYKGSSSGGYESNRMNSGPPEGRRNSYSDRRHVGGGDPYHDNRGGGGRGFNPRASAPPSLNNRWENVDPAVGAGVGGGHDGPGYGGGGGGGGERRSSGGYGRGGGGGGGYGGPRVNQRGFHGDMRPDARLERELFEKQDQQTTGINFDRYDNIPVETSGHDIPDPIDSYTIDTIGEDLMRNTQLCGYHKPTPVQKYSVPIASAGRDLMACAQTGSGKTAGFLFPIIITMIRNGGSPNKGDPRRRTYPEALVLAPTRELASQIHEESRKFTYCTGIASVVIYGGAEVGNQLRNIERGCDLLIATPGRLVDLMERGRLSMECIKFLVLDEADRMLDMGFEPQIRRIVEQEDMPSSDRRQTMMFSATFPPPIQRLASDFLRDYIFLTVGRVGSASKDVTQTVEYVEGNEKIEHLMRFLLTIQEGLILIFVETKRVCDQLEDILCSKGFPACSIHGDKSQNERESALRSFRSGNTPVMVATDVAARGLDIPNVTNVVNYDLPTNIDDYVHRIGRTGRAGNVGFAVSFVNERNSNIIRELRDLLEENDQEVPVWLNRMCNYTARPSGGGARRGRGGGHHFGSRDVRYEKGGRGHDSSQSKGGYNQGGGYGSNYSNAAW